MLYKHQSDAIDFALKNGGNVALFHEPGLGKTRTTLEIFARLRQRVPSLKLLVICPLSLLNAAWGEDVKKFTNFRYSTFKDVRPGQVLPDIIGINFESLISSGRAALIKKTMTAYPFMLAIDESSRMKNHKSVTTKTLLDISPLAVFRLVASGTPMPNSEMELWGQICFVAPDLMPRSFYAFRNEYFHLGRGNQIMHPHGLSRGMMQQLMFTGWKYQITPERRAQLMEHIRPLVHWVKKSEALDLPEKIDTVREVRLSPEERRAYDEMRRDLITEIDGTEVTASVALTKIMKLRQATSGFMYDADRKVLHLGKSSKLRELENLLEELGKQQVIVWVQFREEVRAIAEMIEGMKRTYTTLYAETPNRESAIAEFQAGTKQYLIAHPKSAAHGLTFVNCSCSVFFSLDYSYETHEQARDRIHRIGQDKKCLYIYMLAKDTIDAALLAVVQRKKDLQAVVYDLMKGDNDERITF